MRSEIKSLTALRGVAAAWVVLFHYRPHFSPIISGPWIEKGYLAVDFFFVLSGFVLFYVYSESLKNSTFRYREFLARRVARIYPVHLTTLIVAIVIFYIGGRLGLVPRAQDHLSDAWAHFVLLHAWGVTTGMHLNYPSWSISAEFLAYTIFPLVALIALRIQPRLAVPAALVTFLLWLYIFNAFALPHLDRASIFRLTHDFSIARVVPEFLLGIASGYWAIETKYEFRSPAVIAISVALIGSLWISYDAVFVMIVPLLLAAMHSKNPTPPGWLHFLGTISFSVYMTHGLVEMIGFKTIEIASQVRDGSFPLWTMPAFFLTAVVTGWISWKYIEEPGRRLVQRWLTPTPNA